VSSATPVTLLCCGLLGVTADDGGILERAFTEAFATQGIVPGTAAYARSMVHVHQTRGQSAVDVFRALFPDAPGRAEAATLAFDRSYRLAVDRSGLAPMPGAPEALQQIRGSGVRVCFITGLSRGLLGLVLDTLGWWRQVDLVLCPEDAPRGYPWPDPMLCAMLRLGVTDVRETAYAGGTESGILCGQRAGAQIVAGILTGGHTRDRLRRAGATHLLGSFAELPDVLAAEAAGPVTGPAAGPAAGLAGDAGPGPLPPGQPGGSGTAADPGPAGGPGASAGPGTGKTAGGKAADPGAGPGSSTFGQAPGSAPGLGVQPESAAGRTRPGPPPTAAAPLAPPP
jgi:phosphonatase-like hydrolase